MFRDTSVQDRVIAPPPFWRRRRGSLLLAAGALLLLLVVLPGIVRLWSAQGSVSAKRLSFADVTRGEFTRDLSADGRVVAASSPTLYAGAAGTVTLQVHAGDTVANGQVLATIDSPELNARLAQEQATLQSLTTDFHRAELEAQREDAQARDGARQAEVDAATAQRELERSRKAYELGAYSELQVQRAEDASEKARFAFEQAQRAAQLQPQQSRFEVASRRSLYERQQVLVQDLQRQVDALQVRSPLSGQVGQVVVADRASVAKDAALLSVVDLQQLEVEMKVPESFARDLAPGIPAQLSGGGGQWAGELGAVSPEVVAGEVVARVRFAQGTPAGLRQSQRLNVRVLLDHKDDALQVTRGPWLDQDGGGVAWVVHDGVAERRAIKAGAVAIDRVEIVSGLMPGERIVTSGTELFGTRTRVVISR